MGRRLALLIVLAVLLLPAHAAVAARAPALEASAALVADGRTGEVLFAQDADRRLPIASITKIMTALVTLERARPTEIVTVDRAASSVGGSSIYLRPGERLSVRDLLAASLIQSANDAAYALAEYVGKGDADAFVGLMNAKARTLGLADTHYVRPDGLDAAGHYSSARDVFELARQAMRRPLFRALVRLRTATIAGGRVLHTWNDLLGSFPGLIGVKTGHTLGAGWSEVGAARRGDITVYAVILGSPSRAQRNADLAKLLEWGFDQYRRTTLLTAGREYATAAVPFSDEKVPLVVVDSAEPVVRVGRPLLEEVVAPAVVELPVEPGERVGEVRVYDGSRVVARRPLVSLEGVPKPSLARRLAWYAGRALEHVGGMLETVLGAIL